MIKGGMGETESERKRTINTVKKEKRSYVRMRNLLMLLKYVAF